MASVRGSRHANNSAQSTCVHSTGVRGSDQDQSDRNGFCSQEKQPSERIPMNTKFLIAAAALMPGMSGALAQDVEAGATTLKCAHRAMTSERQRKTRLARY